MEPALKEKILRRFAKVTPAMDAQYWQVSGEGRGRRSQQTGKAIAIVGLVHAGEYEVVLQFPDGKLDSFSPFSLFPAEAAAFIPQSEFRTPQSIMITCIFCNKFKGTPRSLRQHTCVTKPGGKKHLLTREEWENCLAFAQLRAIRPKKQPAFKKRRCLHNHIADVINPWNAL